MNSTYETDDSVDLSQFDEAYARADSRPPDPNKDIPDGTYDTVIEEVRLSRTARTNNPMVIFRMRILGPDCAGRVLTKTRVVTEKTVPFLKQDLEFLGLQIHRLSDLGSHLKELEELPLSVWKRTRGDFCDIFFQRAKSGSAGPHGSIGDDDLPF